MLEAKDLKGIIPANIVPFKEDFSIDEDTLRNFLHFLLQAKGVNGILCNGHAGEVASLTRFEQIQIIKIVVEEVQKKVPVISGVLAESTSEAVTCANQAKEAGANAILLFPPSTWLRGKAENAPYEFFKEVANSIDLPVIVFQYGANTLASYSIKALEQIFSIDGVIGVKDGSRDVFVGTSIFKLIKSFSKEISYLSAYNQALFQSMSIGADGAIIGSGNLIPDLIGELFQALKDQNISLAQKLHLRIAPIIEVFYQNPVCDVYTRIKEAHVMMGRFENSLVRRPLLPIPEKERKQIKDILFQADLL